VLVQVALEALEAFVKRAVGRASIVGNGEPPTQDAEADEGRADPFVLHFEAVESRLDVLADRTCAIGHPPPARQVLPQRHVVARDDVIEQGPERSVGKGASFRHLARGGGRDVGDQRVGGDFHGPSLVRLSVLVRCRGGPRAVGRRRGGVKVQALDAVGEFHVRLDELAAGAHALVGLLLRGGSTREPFTDPSLHVVPDGRRQFVGVPALEVLVRKGDCRLDGRAGGQDARMGCALVRTVDPHQVLEEVLVGQRLGFGVLSADRKRSCEGRPDLGFRRGLDSLEDGSDVPSGKRDFRGGDNGTVNRVAVGGGGTGGEQAARDDEGGDG
jgi:hypothetical protein